MAVTLHILGDPFVEIDGVRTPLPLRKAEAMLCYIALEGRVPRERLKVLFWGDKDDDQASNNLRNAIYVLRRALPGNISAGRRHVALEGVSMDVDAIDLVADPKTPIPPNLMDEPMRGLDMHGIPEFEEWRALAASAIKNRIADGIRRRITECYDAKHSLELISSLSALLSLEPFDEDSVLELMEAWRDAGQIPKAVELYGSYRRRMESEIGASPSARAEEYFSRMLANDASLREGREMPGEPFRCREREMDRIMNLASRGRGKIILLFIHGEAGVGKTALVNRAVKLLASPSSEVFRARPYSVGEKYPYSAWNDIAAKIGSRARELGISVDPSISAVLGGVFYDFMRGSAAAGGADGSPYEINPVAAGRMLAGLAGLVAGDGAPIFVLEDLHWFDSQSMFLLKSFFSETRIPLIAFLTGRPESVPHVAETLYGMKCPIPFELAQIRLTPFDARDTLRFCREFLPESVISHRGEEYFIRESEGMPLLLVEMLRMLREDPDADCSEGLMGVLMSRMEGLSPLQREMMEILSVFGSGAASEDLASVMGLDPAELMAPAEGLLRKQLVRETEERGAYLIDFRHANVRECLYGSIPGFRRRVLHSRIAGALSARYSPRAWNSELCAALCHHYRMAGLRDKELNQYLTEMEHHIYLNHTLFPLVQDRVLLSYSVPFSSREETEFKIKQAGELLQEIKGGGDGSDLASKSRMEASYLELCGGYLVNWGEYREGRVLINNALAIAMESGFDEIHAHCLEHIAHYFLQTDDSSKLLAYGRAMLHLTRRMGSAPQMGVALRFIGMSKVIERDFERAEKIFIRSAGVFEELALIGGHYTLNLLAPHCYIGETRQWRGDLDGAFERFTRCIDRCTEAGLFWGRSHFHAHAADAALDMGDWGLLERHVDAGSTLFESSRGGHCGALLYSLKAIIDAMRGNAGDALASLKTGDFLSAIGKKSWCAPQFMAKAWVAGMIERGELAEGDQLGEYLKRPSGLYAAAAESLYREIGAEARADLVRKKFL